LPVFINFSGAKRRLEFRVSMDMLDYERLLPVFVEGLCETQEPYVFIAYEGVMAMLSSGNGRGRVLACVRNLVEPLRRALESREPLVVWRVCNVLKALVQSDDYVGEALVPYYRKLLPVLNWFFTHPVSVRPFGTTEASVEMTYVVEEAMQMLEDTGGKHAPMNLRYMVPTFLSIAGAKTRR
jgi:hypothetical protein